MLGIDWVNHVVLDSGCIGLKGKFIRGLASEYVTRKPIVNCIFDIVNTKNPSGGMIGPGNCQWLHNTLLFLSGAISPEMQKLLKNHAAVHDACGFMLTHTDIGSGYGFGYFPQNAVNVSSAGATRNGVLHWLLSWSGVGQITGLVVLRSLMKQLAAPYFNDHDEEDKNEKCVMNKHYYDFSKGVKDNNNDDGRFDC